MRPLPIMMAIVVAFFARCLRRAPGEEEEAARTLFVLGFPFLFYGILADEVRSLFFMKGPYLLLNGILFKKMPLVKPLNGFYFSLGIAFLKTMLMIKAVYSAFSAEGP